MRADLLILTLAAAATLLPAQGLPPDWEIRKTLAETTEQTNRLQPLIDRLKPQDWLAAGAPGAYIAQRQSLLNEIKYLDQTLKTLAAKPDRMTRALEAVNRLGTIESRLFSLIDAVRRYQNPAIADIIQSIAAETAASRDKLRQYTWDLIAHREQEFDVLEQEAQRCRLAPAKK